MTSAGGDREDLAARQWRGFRLVAAPLFAIKDIKKEDRPVDEACPGVAS